MSPFRRRRSAPRPSKRAQDDSGYHQGSPRQQQDTARSYDSSGKKDQQRNQRSKTRDEAHDDRVPKGHAEAVHSKPKQNGPDTTAHPKECLDAEISRRGGSIHSPDVGDQKKSDDPVKNEHTEKRKSRPRVLP